VTSVADVPGAQVHTLTGAYVCDALGEDERAVFETHLTECPECATEVGELREVTALMAVAVSERPPESLKAAVNARIRVTRQAPPITTEPTPGRPARQGVVRRLRAAWAAAAALVLLVAGLGWRSVDQQHQINALNAQAAGIAQLLAAPDAAAVRVPVTGGGSALVVDSRSRDEAAVSLTGLADAPAGRTYQLWLIAPGGSTRSVGLLAAAPPRLILIQGLAGQDEVGMTVEPAGGSPKPTTAPVMVAALGS
jgi:anti-sigma-K factor RskA